MGANLTEQDLIDFEEDIKECYAKGQIPYPIHLRGNNETNLIQIFSQIKEDDWIFCSWASHLEALLHSIDKKKIKKKIFDGYSISLCIPEKNFYSSGIVGNCVSAALGVAMSLKIQKKPQSVFLFIGDMTAESGIVAETLKYSKNHNLDNLWFIIADNGVSVTTDTRKVWGSNKPQFDTSNPRIIYYQYKNKYHHSGIGSNIAF